jgi:hypothetical protein
METLSEAIGRLEAAGYREGFRATREGLRALAAGRSYAPESLAVDEVLRFEGPTDPGDESVLFALRGPDGVRGTWAIAYGPGTDPVDAEIARRLKRSRQ